MCVNCGILISWGRDWKEGWIKLLLNSTGLGWKVFCVREEEWCINWGYWGVVGIKFKWRLVFEEIEGIDSLLFGKTIGRCSDELGRIRGGGENWDWGTLNCGVCCCGRITYTAGRGCWVGNGCWESVLGFNLSWTIGGRYSCEGWPLFW